jgi:hypothetical protein
MIWVWAAWGLFYSLRGLDPQNLNKRFQRLNDFPFKDYVNKNKQTFDVTVVVVRHITLQRL